MLPTKFDVPGAANRIEEFIEENTNTPIDGVYFPSDWLKHFVYGESQFECVPYGKPESYRMAVDGSEFAFRMIGAIDDFSLPPFERHRMQHSKLQYIQQVLSLNSLRAPRCTKDIEAMHDILDTFSRRVASDVDQSWVVSTGHNVRFSNRLLVPTDENQKQTVCALPFAVDPTGALRAKAESCGLVHTDDNVVEYLRLLGDRCVQTTPAAIRRGDIAEVRFSVGLFATSKSSLLVKLILRAVIVIDGEFARKARRMAYSTSKTMSEPTLKRKRVINDSGEGSTRAIKVPRVKFENHTDEANVEAPAPLRGMPCPTTRPPSPRIPLQPRDIQDVEMIDDSDSSPAIAI
ncbi:hypothetical protein AURDEDRAFT_176717 [Auricularia subglabra TFB-10046 SS5]|uniref:Uncharacterized protein n=1 Tax=Auricularia subglabra (strain TFB-10046 / SS5) TaxID=717982 RepID=J0CV11_AURST|nr:hypothetical protein AURDEDRAFT_176717 [Auricularia subglabra TFB-10046 SS5]